MHQVIVFGNVGKTPELRYTPTGTPYLPFSVGENRTYTDRDGVKQKKTTWFRCVLWSKRAEGLAPYIKKGMAVLVRGRLNANDQGNPKVWQGENGARASYELTVEEFTFGGGGSREEAQEPARSMNDLPDLEDEDFLDF